MAMCIIHGLLEAQRDQPKKDLSLNLDNITKYFGMWFREAFGKNS